MRYSIWYNTQKKFILTLFIVWKPTNNRFIRTRINVRDVLRNIRRKHKAKQSVLSFQRFPTEMVVACRSFSPATFAHVTGINSSGYEWERVSRAGYFIRRIKLRPMSSICFSPNSSFPFFFSHPYSFTRHRLAPGVAALWRLGRKTFPCVAVLFRFPQEDSRHTHLRSFISKLHARILDTTRLEVFSRGRPHPRPFRFLLLFEDMHYAMPRVSKKVLSRFSLAFCIYPRCFACRYDCSDKICTMCDAVYFGCPILYVIYSLFLSVFLFDYFWYLRTQTRSVSPIFS